MSNQELATKQDLHEVKTELQQEIQTAKTELRQEMQEMKTELRQDMKEFKEEIIHQFKIIAESLRDDIKIIAEGHQMLYERTDRLIYELKSELTAHRNSTELHSVREKKKSNRAGR
ncbi:MAG: hypothetical protein HZA78_03680 [Candidatus Schekmanbacteria bacterium]|nr:hypothetical protein [Candidatus Schekmanbacteria bacterium]